MDRLPYEVCAQIFALACRDSGYTGRSLSLVSRRIGEISKPLKFQSMSVQGHDQILAFSSILKKTPPAYRTVRYLFISSNNLHPTPNEDTFDERYELEELTEFTAASPPSSDCYDDSSQRTSANPDLERTQNSTKALGTAVAKAAQSILRQVSQSLEILETALSYHITSCVDDADPISLPHLKELTAHDRFSVGYRAQGSPIFAPCQKLRRLHIARVSQMQTRGRDLFGDIGRLAPSLTHLRVSGLHQEYNFGTELELALGVELKDLDTKISIPKAIARLPSCVQMVVVKPDVRPAIEESCGPSETTYDTLLRHLRRLSEGDDRVILLEAPDGNPEVSELKLEWLDRVDGGKGCW